MRTVGRAVALAALVPCLAMGAPVLAPAPVRAAPQVKARAQVGMALTKVSPKSVGETSRIEISGLAKNRSGHQMPGLTLRLRYSAQPVTSRSQLDRLAATPPNALPNIGPQQQLPGAATPGVKQSWSLRTTPRELRLQAPTNAPGVYPVGVEVLNPAQQVVGGVTTFLTFMPKQRHFKPVQVGWVWPLADRMHRTGDRTFFDDELNKAMAPGGRLHRLVTAAAATDTPVTWAIDPALLDDARRMASGDYTVKSLGARKGVRKEQSAAATSWLTALKSATKSDPYFALPYGDPDIVALVRRKTPRDITVAFDERNTRIVPDVLGRPAGARIAWPPAGAAGPGTLDQLVENALQDGGAFLMNSAHFQNPATPGTLPNATTTVPTRHGDRTALLYDDKINQIVSERTRSESGALLTEQRFLAETAMIAAEAPNVQRTVVVAPDRQWDPTGELAKRLLTYTQKAGWLRAAPLRKIESARPQERVFNGYPDSYERYELGDAHLTQARAIAKQAATFRGVMTDPVHISYERALLRLESVAWRSSPGHAKRARRELKNELEADMHKVRVVTTKNKRVLMGGSSGRLPVLVENMLPDQSVRVHLVAKSENRAKLQLGELAPEDAVIELGPRERAQRWIPAQAAGNGNFHVQLELQVPDSGGRTYGDGEEIMVTVTGYGRLALLITGGGLAVLFVGVGVRAIRARRRRKAEAADDGATGLGAAGAGERETGFPAAGFSGSGPSSAGAAPAGEPGPSGAGGATAASAEPGVSAGPEPSAGAGPSAESRPSAESAAGPAEPGGSAAAGGAEHRRRDGD